MERENNTRDRWLTVDDETRLLLVTALHDRNELG
jgi:hypothetical protein